MTFNRIVPFLVIVAFVWVQAPPHASADKSNPEPKVEILRAPNGGVQPRAVVDGDGTIHLVYFKAKGAKGDLFYTTRALNAEEWSDSIRVNTEAGSAVRNGSLSLAQISLGKKGRAHITWFDMRAEKYWYARTNDAGDAFEPQRVVVEENFHGVEAGAAITSDDSGAVYVVWHAGNLALEAKRGVFLRKSDDDGETFGPETKIDLNGKGVCGCCALSAVVDAKNTLYVSYRTAGKGVHRDMTLLKSTDGGRSFTDKMIDPWELGSCPVTITRLQAKPKRGVVVAWETRDQAFFADAGKLSEKISVGMPPTGARQKNAAHATARDGSTIVVWAEGKSWSMGGKLNWQIFDSKGKPLGVKGEGAVNMPRTTIPEVVARQNGEFVILY
jgi:hypothetical protein